MGLSLAPLLDRGASQCHVTPAEAPTAADADEYVTLGGRARGPGHVRASLLDSDPATPRG